MDFIDYIIILVIGLVFIALFVFPYYLRNRRFANFVKSFGFSPKPLDSTLSLQIFNTDHPPGKKIYSGVHKDMPMSLVPLLHSYLVIVPVHKTFEGTYIISKLSNIPKNNVLAWNSKAPLEYPEFNSLFKVFAKKTDTPFYDVGPLEMQKLIESHEIIKDSSFELSGNNIYILSGYEQPETGGLVQMLIYNITKIYNRKENSKIVKALNEGFHISKIFNN